MIWMLVVKSKAGHSKFKVMIVCKKQRYALITIEKCKNALVETQLSMAHVHIFAFVLDDTFMEENIKYIINCQQLCFPYGINT